MDSKQSDTAKTINLQNSICLPSHVFFHSLIIFFVTGTLYSTFDNVTAACGTCAPSGGCGGSGTQAGAVLVSEIFLYSFEKFLKYSLIAYFQLIYRIFHNCFLLY